MPEFPRSRSLTHCLSTVRSNILNMALCQVCVENKCAGAVLMGLLLVICGVGILWIGKGVFALEILGATVITTFSVLLCIVMLFKMIDSRKLLLRQPIFSLTLVQIF